jgi:PKD repeat protein
VLQAPYNRGRTLSHETGHWLGLRHIWGDGACGDDYCADTPPQSSESRGCSAGRTSNCNGVTYTNLVQNYMDYSDDACMNIFTRDQKSRMRQVMELSPRRRELVSSAVCGPQVSARPIPNFRASRERVLLGSTVTFTDLSSRFPTRRLWTFEGGSPTTSTELNPTVTYTTPGKFKVKLEVFNAVGGDSLVRDNYIEVLNAGLCGGLSNFINDVDTSKPATPTLLRVPPPGKGYVSGHNSLRDRAKSEFFGNDLGYTNMDGVAIRFGAVYASQPEAVATITVWNARGVQGGPGQVLERKQVPLSVIAQDVARGAPTQVTFERNVPLNGLPFHVGVEFNYNGDSLAIITTANGESNFATSWRQDSTGRWDRYTTSLGLNVAHAIRASVGVKSSVQVFASSLYINAGETVTLSAGGTNLYAWQSPNNDLNTTLGPQVIAQPTQTTTYTVTGGGDLCNATARVTVYVRNPTALSPEALERQLTVYPNPGNGVFVLDVVNNLTGAVEIGVYNAVGRQLSRGRDAKTGEAFRKTLDLSTLPGGVYFVEFTLGELKVRKKVVKL